MTRQKLELWLFAVVLIGTAVAQCASMAHMLVAYSYANSSVTAWLLAIVTVIMSAVVVTLGVINREPKIRWAIRTGIAILGTVEFLGNLGIGGLLAQRYLPAELAAFFGIDLGIAQRLGAFLFAGFLPLLVFLSVYAVAETGQRFIQEPEVNAFADAALRLENAGNSTSMDGLLLNLRDNKRGQQ